MQEVKCILLYDVSEDSLKLSPLQYFISRNNQLCAYLSVPLKLGRV